MYAQVVSDEVGANCVIAASSPPPTWAPGKEPVPRLRFQEGARDEVRNWYQAPSSHL